MTHLRHKIPTRMYALGLSLLLLLTLALPAAADPQEELQENAQRRQVLEARIDRLESRSGQLSTRIQTADAKVELAQAQVDALDKRIGKLSKRIGEVREDLEDAQKHLAILTKELQDILERLDSRMDAFTLRAVAAYIAGPAAYVDGILSSESFSDLIDRYTYYESALDTDSQLVEEIRMLRDETENRRDEVEEKEERIALAKLRLEQDRAEMSAVRHERAQVLAQRREVLGAKKGLLAEVESTKRRYEELVRQLDADSERIRALLSGTVTSTVQGGGQLLWPTSGPVTSGYGYRTHPIYGDRRLHTGIDIGAPYGAQVVAADDGVVSYAGVMSGYGNVVVIDHGGGLATVYAHLSAYSVGGGQGVSRGSPIAAVGCTGYCTGTHLHFEVRINGNPVDPMPYLQ